MFGYWPSLEIVDYSQKATKSRYRDCGFVGCVAGLKAHLRHTLTPGVNTVTPGIQPRVDSRRKMKAHEKDIANSIFSSDWNSLCSEVCSEREKKKNSVMNNLREQRCLPQHILSCAREAFWDTIQLHAPTHPAHLPQQRHTSLEKELESEGARG